jgi:hypothetical protein
VAPSKPPDRQVPEVEIANAPTSEPSPLEREQAEREAAVRAEQVRLQAAYEQAEKIKLAGRNRVWWSTGPAKRIVGRAGPHYATPDGRPYGSARSRGD